MKKVLIFFLVLIIFSCWSIYHRYNFDVQAAADPVFRVNEYYINSGFTGTVYNLTLDQDLASNYFVIVQGSDGDGLSTGNYGPDANYAALIGDPFGTGNLAFTGSSNLITLERGSSGNSWIGVVTVVECLQDCDSQGFELLDIQRVVHNNADTVGADSSGASWGDINQVMLMGGFNGPGCMTDDPHTRDSKVCHVRIWPNGNDQINWSRNGTGASLSTAVSTIMVLEWGSDWLVQRVNVTGSAGGDGADATNEYDTGSLAQAVERQSTWVWGTGHTNDQGIGDAGEGSIITLGNGVDVNSVESTVAVGQEYSDSRDFEVYALTHPLLLTDYHFKEDGNVDDLIVDVPIVNADSERMALVYNGQNGTGNAYPRPIFSARYLDSNTVRLERRRTGQNFPAWVQGIDWTNIVSGPLISQLHFGWRDDSTDLNTAGGFMGGADDNNIGEIEKNTPIRLRMEIANQGNGAGLSTKSYQLQWGEKISNCDSVLAWNDMGSAGDQFEMVESVHIEPDGEPTTVSFSPNVEGYTYFSGEGRDVADTTSAIGPLPANYFTELEYSFQATDYAVGGITYCFRLYDTQAGSPLAAYYVYPELTVKWTRDTDFHIQRGSLQLSGTSATITAGTDYEAPVDLENAFIRLTNTQLTGAGDDIGGGAQDADDVTVVISNPDNLLDSITFTRFGTTDNTRVSWEIIEYIGGVEGVNEMKIRGQGVSAYGVGDLNVASAAISGVNDDNDVVVFITSQANPDSGRNNYNTGLSTAGWNSGSQQAEFSRGESANNAVQVSWAVVEFTGAQWQIQRAEHTYGNAGIVETESINPVNDLSRAFLHTQKRVGGGLRGLDEFGHEVWLSANDTISFQIEGSAGTPSDHTSVSWVIENTQTSGSSMVVTRSNGVQSVGSEPVVENVSLGKTIEDLGIASIWTNNRVTGTGTYYPRPIMGVQIISQNEYQLWVSDTGQSRTYRTEVVEWPTASGNYATNGAYVSNAFDTGGLSAINVIEWDWSKTNLNCSLCNIRLQIQTAPDAGGSPGVWSPTWSGPEGEDGDETDYYTISTGELIHTDHNGDQWVRYRAILDGDGNDTPVLEEVRINYQ